MPEFIFDAKVQRYRYASMPNKGAFVSASALDNLVGKAIADEQARIREFSKKLISGEIRVGQWEAEVADSIRKLNLWQYGLGYGGLGNLQRSPDKERHYGILGAEQRFQRKYLRRFSQDLMRKGMSEAQFYSRLDKYFGRTQAMYARAKTEGHKEAGYQWERRYRTKSNSCNDCVGYEARNFQPIGSLPEPCTACQCGGNCGCVKRYYKEKPEQDAQALLKRLRFGWINSKKPAVHQ